MKKVEAIIRPSQLDAVRTAIAKLGIEGMTITEVSGVGRERGHAMLYRGTLFLVDYLARVKVEIVVSDENASPVALAILDAARTGRNGDGRVWILPVDEAVRIRTGERGPAAVGRPAAQTEHWTRTGATHPAEISAHCPALGTRPPVYTYSAPTSWQCEVRPIARFPCGTKVA
jgi:nitrogen regulatory protein P-II 1